MRIDLLLLADDLTGALDGTVCFSNRGVGVSVALTSGATASTPVLGLDLRTRGSSAADAREAISTELGRYQPKRIFKKVDSALRGRFAPELAVMCERLPDRKLVVAPAFPAQGRTTRDGVQVLSGYGSPHRVDLCGVLSDGGLDTALVPLSVVRDGADQLVERIRAAPQQVLVADAETETDLSAIASALAQLDLTVPVGSAGLAAALADVLLPQPTGPTGALQVKGPVLVVAGSPHSATREQVRVAVEHGATVEYVSKGETLDQASARHLVEDIGPEDIVVLSAPDAPLSEAPRDSEYSAALSGAAYKLLAAKEFGGLIVTGGETAARLCGSLGVTVLLPRHELARGTVLSHTDVSSVPSLVTRAGSFGDSLAIVSVAKAMKEAV